MYFQTSQRYKDAIYNSSVQAVINIYIDDVLVNPQYITDFKSGCELFEEELELGSVPSQYIEMQIHKNSGITNPKKIRIEYGILVNNASTVAEVNNMLVCDLNKLQIKSLAKYNNSFEMIPIGTYNVDDYNEEDSNVINIKALDNIIKLDTNDGYYDASELINEKGYATLGEIAQDICDKKGLELETSSFLNSSNKISVYDNQLSARGYMSYIAEKAGGFCCANRQGKIEFRKIGQDTVEIPLRLFKTYKFGEEYRISRVAFEDGIRSFKFGNETRNTLWIRQDNLFVTAKKEIQDIYDEIKDLTINSFEGTVLIDPAIDIGDKIKIGDKYIIYQGEMTLNKRFIADIRSKISIKQKQETTVKKENQKIINRRVQSEINQIEGNINLLAEETTEIQGKINETVKNVDVLYALGTSETTAPTTGWSTTAPAWQNGKYMWQKTITTYTNDNTSESNPTCISGAKGNKGNDGAKGENGIGIDDIVEQYYLSTSNTTQTGGSWKDTQDTWKEGHYIWIRSKITWSDGNITYTDPILSTGLNGALEGINNIINTQATKEGTTIKIDDSAEEPILEFEADGHSEQATRDGKNKFNLDYVPDGSSYVVKKETGVNLVNCWVSDAFGANSWSKILDTFKPKTTYTMKAKAKVVSRPSTITGSNLALFALYRPSTNSLGNAWAECLRMNDKETISLNTEKEYITTFKTPSNMTDVRFVTYCFHGNNTGETEVSKGTGMGEIDVSEIMLVEGSYTAENFPDFELYGVSPSPSYPSEIKSVGESWNKLPNKNSTRTINGVTFTHNKDDSITLNGTATSKAIYPINVDSLNIAQNIKLEKGNYLVSGANENAIVQVFYTSNQTTLYVTKNFSIEQATNLGAYVIANAGETYNNVTVYPQIVEGTEKKPYRPFGYNLFIEKSGKNKLNVQETFVVKKSIDIPCNLDAGNYVFSAKSRTTSETSEYSLLGFLKNGNVISTNNFGSTLNKTIALTSDIDTIRIYSAETYAASQNITTTFTELMISKDGGDYEPYFHETYTIPLSKPLRSLPNGVKDTLEANGIHRRVGSVILDGSENWTGYTNIGNNARAYYIYNGIKKQSQCLSNYFKYSSLFETDEIGINLNPYETSLIAIKIPLTELETEDIQGIKNWLSTHNTEVTYELAEEVVEPYTEEQLEVIQSIETNLYTQYFSSDANMRIKYVRNNGLTDLYETKNNAERNYTETKRNIAELDIKSNEIIASVEEVVTSLNNDVDLLSADMQNKLRELGQALTEYQTTVSTQFQQTNTDFNFLFNTLVEQINNTTGDTNEKLLEINKYIRFEDGNIILGRSDNELVLKIQNDRISYTQNGSEVAYFSNNKLYVNELEVITKFYLGNFAFIPRTNGNLSFKKVRG